MTVNAADGLTAIAAGGRGDASRRMSSGSGAGVGGWLRGWVANHVTLSNQIKRIPGSTNHVRVHAAHDREHGCYNSFTLCRGGTRSP
jgi:hypothetical protein